MRKWREIFKPITKRGNAKPKQVRITFDTHVKGTFMAYCASVRLLQVRAGAEPRNLAVGDPEVVEVGPAMFSIPQVRLAMVSKQFLFAFRKIQTSYIKPITTNVNDLVNQFT